MTSREGDTVQSELVVRAEIQSWSSPALALSAPERGSDPFPRGPRRSEDRHGIVLAGVTSSASCAEIQS